MGVFVRDEGHWLRRFSPEEWIRAALGEMKRAEAAYAARDVRGGLAGAKRAAGMALNAVVLLEGREDWGRSYVDHVMALGRDVGAPEAVRTACHVLLEAAPPGPSIIQLRGSKTHERVLEAARDVMAHAFAVTVRLGPQQPNLEESSDA